MHDPVRAVVGGRAIRRSEVTARMWAAQERMVAVAREYAAQIDELIEWPANSEFRYHTELLEPAYKQQDPAAWWEQQDPAAWWERLLVVVRKLFDLKESGVL